MAEKVISFSLSLKNVESELREINKPHQLGIHLGVPPEDLERFEKDYPYDVIRQRAEVINHWLKNGDATWEALARAVGKVGGHKNLVTRLRNLAKGVANLGGTGDEAKGSDNEETEPEGGKNANSECSKSEEGLYQHILSKDEVIKIDTEAKKKLLSEQELASDTLRIMKFDFTTLMTAVRLSLEKHEVSVESLLCHLRSIEAIGPSFKPVYVDHSEPLKTVAAHEFHSIKEVFVALAPYCSWFNHLIIDNIIETFCEGDEDVERKRMTFQGKVKKYCEHRVIDCTVDQYGEHDESETRETMVMKIDRNWETIQVNQLFCIRDSVAKILDIKPLNLYLCTVEKGCIEMIFYISDYTKSRINHTAKTEAAALSNIGVKMIDDVTYGWESKVPRKRRRLMWSEYDYNVTVPNSYPVPKSGSTALGHYLSMLIPNEQLQVVENKSYKPPSLLVPRLTWYFLLLLALRLPRPYNYYGVLNWVIGAVLLYKYCNKVNKIWFRVRRF